MTFGVYQVSQCTSDFGGKAINESLLYPTTPPLALSFSFFFALLSTCRFALNLGILERPLALGVMLGVCTGLWQESLGIAIFYELLWLDQFPAGTFIPPNFVLSTCLSLGLTYYFGLTKARTIMLPLLMGIPIALIGSRLEVLQRRWQDAGYSALLYWARHSHERECKDSSPERLVAISLLQLFGSNFTVFAVTILSCIWVLNWFKVPDSLQKLELPLEWGHLWFLATLGGVLSLRVRRAYTVLVIGLIVAVALGLVYDL